MEFVGNIKVSTRNIGSERIKNLLII